MSRPAIEAALRQNPDDEQAWAVFGDLLAASGDSRGELIALEQRIASATRELEREVLRHRADELFDREHRSWLGALAESGAVEVVWHRGFAIEATIHKRVAASLKRLLELPTSALLRKLAVPRARSCTAIAKQIADRELEALEFRDPSFTRVEALGQLAGLRRLRLAHAAPEDLDRLAELPTLERLELPRLRVDLRGLAGGFEALRRLDLSFHNDPVIAGSATLDPLAALPALRELDLGHAGWLELTPLAALEQLERLVLCSTDAYDLRPLAGLTQLRELDLRGSSMVADLRPLAELRGLEVLRVGYTRVRDLRPLAALEGLRVLDIAGTPVQNVAPLLELPALERVNIRASELTEIEPLLERGVVVEGRPPTASPSWRDLAEGLLADAREGR